MGMYPVSDWLSVAHEIKTASSQESGFSERSYVVAECSIAAREEVRPKNHFLRAPLVCLTLIGRIYYTITFCNNLCYWELFHCQPNWVNEDHPSPRVIWQQ